MDSEFKVGVLLECEENQNVAILKLPFGILILTCLLRNETKKEALTLPLVLLGDSDRRSCFRKETLFGSLI